MVRTVCEVKNIVLINIYYIQVSNLYFSDDIKYSIKFMIVFLFEL